MPALGCEDPAIAAIQGALTAPTSQGKPTQETLGAVFVSLVAAIHTKTALPKPPPPLPQEDENEEASLSALDWLLIASTTHTQSAATNATLEAVEAAIASADHVLQCKTSPLVTYALGPLLAEAHGEPTNETWIHAGNSLGKLLRLAHEARTITSSDARFPRPLLLGALAEEEGLGERFRLALTEAHKPLPNRLPMLSVFGDKRLIERIQRETRALRQDIEALPASTSEDKHLQTIAVELSSEIERKTQAARFFGLAALGTKTAAKREIERAITLATSALEEDDGLREAWDIQRWGGHFGKGAVAKMFPRGLVAWALAQAGKPAAEKLRALMTPSSVDGYRYFEQFPQIPPDADELGLGLQLAACLSQQGEEVSLAPLEWPIELLVRSTADDGAMPVWLKRDLREPLPENAPEWLGPRCLAVSANALVGLAEARAPLPKGYLERATRWVLETWEKEGMGAVFHYGAPFTRFILTRLCCVAETVVEGEELKRAIATRKQDLAREILAKQRVDGGFSGPLATAFHLAALAKTATNEASCIERAALYLAARQEPDGLYAREPLYVTPGKDDLLGAYGSRAVSTAFCLYALVCARRFTEGSAG